MQSRRPRLTYVVTHPASARILLHGQLAQMRAWGFDVSVVSAPGPDLEVVCAREGVEVATVPMVRGFGVGADAVSLARMVRTLRRLRPDIVNASTPKAGLLGMLAARALGVPVRIYLVRGLRLETATGAARAVLAATERIAAACATDVIAVSRSLAEAYRRGGFAQGVAVLGDGSSNGVDTTHFAPSPELDAAAARLRAELGIAADAPVVGFVGRLAPDKGIVDLLDACAALRSRLPRARLLVLSADLEDEGTPADLLARVRGAPGVSVLPRRDDVRPFLRAIDVLGFPSYREGFPNVVLEAAALQRPAVGYVVTGVRDAIEDGVTGVLLPPRDVEALAGALAGYLADRARIARDGAAARARVSACFERSRIVSLWADLYVERLGQRGLPGPRRS